MTVQNTALESLIFKYDSSKSYQKDNITHRQQQYEVCRCL